MTVESAQDTLSKGWHMPLLLMYSSQDVLYADIIALLVLFAILF